MKPEPLKSKIQLVNVEGELFPLVSKEDIKSAVKWLKEKINLDINTYENWNWELTSYEKAENEVRRECLEYIDKAFEDVINK